MTTRATVPTTTRTFPTRPPRRRCFPCSIPRCAALVALPAPARGQALTTPTPSPPHPHAHTGERLHEPNLRPRVVALRKPHHYGLAQRDGDDVPRQCCVQGLHPGLPPRALARVFHAERVGRTRHLGQRPARHGAIQQHRDGLFYAAAVRLSARASLHARCPERLRVRDRHRGCWLRLHEQGGRRPRVGHGWALGPRADRSRRNADTHRTCGSPVRRPDAVEPSIVQRLAYDV